MKLRSTMAPSARARAVAGLLLALMASHAFAQAQTGPIAAQNLFFDEASNARQRNDLEAQAGVFYTDNVLLQQGSGGDTLAMLGLVGNTSREGSRLDYRLASDIALVKYLRSGFPTQPFGYLDGSAELKIVPGFFSWLARDSYSEAVIQPLGPATPDNLEALNYVTTGPRFMVRPTLRTTIVLNGTYSYLDSSSKSPLYININNHRYGGDLTFSRAFSNTLSAYITGSSGKVTFADQVINTNFRQDQALAGIKFGDARTVLDVGGGYVRLHETALTTVQSVTGPRESLQKQSPRGTNWRAALSRLISPTQRVSLRAVKQVTDAANLFFLNIDSPVPTSLPIRIVSGQPFTDREFGATWLLQANRTSFRVDVMDISDRYQATPRANHDVKLASALVARQLSPVLNWDIGVAYEHDAYEFGKANTINAITSLRWQVGPRVKLRFIYAHSTLSPNGYHENQVGVTASYALTRPATSGSQGGQTPGLQPIDPMSSQQPPLQ